MADSRMADITADERTLPWLAGPLSRLRDHRHGHALILHGGAGSGLFELALRVAQAWLCERGPTDPPAPCDVCVSCHLAATHGHSDLLVVVPEALRASLGWHAAEDADAVPADGESKGRRKPSREIKVDDVRAAIEWAHSSSARARGKVMVFHPADTLNTVAANALLKTLEEPASNLRLLLCVDDPERLLPTLRSRCQRVRLAPPAPEQALTWLLSQGVGSADDAQALLAAAGGEPLTARALWKEGLTAAVWADLPRQVRSGDVSVLSGLALPRAIGVLQQICHDAMRAAAGAPPRFFGPRALQAGRTGANGDKTAASSTDGRAERSPAAWAESADAVGALSVWRQALVRAARHDEHPWNAPLLVESLVLQGRQAMTPAAPGPAAPIGKLRR